MIRILYRLIDIDRRIIFVFVFLGVAVPLLKSCPLPINPTDPVLSVYREIEGVAEKNGVVLLSFSYGASTVPEMQPMARAILRHCFSRDVKVVAVSSAGRLRRGRHHHRVRRRRLRRASALGIPVDLLLVACCGAPAGERAGGTRRHKAGMIPASAPIGPV